MLLRHILQRLLLMVPTVFGATVIIFLMIRVQPGDVVVARLADAPGATTKDAQELRHKLGLDEPLPAQYLHWMGHTLRGDFGNSLWSDRPIRHQVARALPITLEIAAFATLLGALFGITVGMLSAAMPDRPLDYGLRFLSIAGLSVPTFWVGTLLVVLPVTWWGYLPPLVYRSFAQDPLYHLQQIAFPVITLALPLSAATMRLTRSAALEVSREDYVRTARAKGLGTARVTMRHLLPNALLPVIALIGTQFGTLVGATLIVESIFGIPGMGRLMFDAVQTRDYTMVQSGVFIFAVVFVAVNLAVDIAYVVVNPRVRLG